MVSARAGVQQDRDTFRGRHPDRFPSVRVDANAGLAKTHRDEDRLVIESPGRHHRRIDHRRPGAPSLVAGQRAAVFIGMKCDPRLRRLGGPHRPQSGGPRTVEFRENGQRIGMPFVHFRERKIDRRHGGERPPAFQGAPAGGQRQVGQVVHQERPHRFSHRRR